MHFKNIKSIYLIVCVLQGFFSTSTPDQFGLWEILIGAGLVVVFNPIVVKNSFQFIHQGLYRVNSEYFIIIFSIIYFYLVQTFSGLLMVGNEFSDYFRDFVPLIFISIPIFGIALVLKKKSNVGSGISLDDLVIGLAIIGAGYLLQYFSSDDFNINEIGQRLMIGESADNILQDPAVSFLSVLVVIKSYEYLKLKRYINSLIFFIFSCVLIVAYMAAVLRAPLGLLAASFLAYLFLSPNKNKNKVGSLIIFLGGAIFIFTMWGESLIGLLVEKHVNTGSNGRFEEISIVYESVSGFWTSVFGYGLGGKYPDPFGLGYVRYTHNIITYAYLKSGFIGLMLCIYFLFSCGVIVVRALRSDASNHRIYAASSIAPLFSATMLEPMYKTLTFGILLLVIFGISVLEKRS